MSKFKIWTEAEKIRFRRIISEARPTPKPNGVSCPECGIELVDINPHMILQMNPPQKDVKCNSCGYRGKRPIQETSDS